MINFFLMLFCCLGSSAFAQEIPSFETVVEDVIFNTSSRIIIDQKLIKDSRAPNITTLLAGQANVTISSTPFQPNSIYIRGGDSGHVLILVDGVPFYDAATIQRTFNLNSINIKTVRRIEIIKGSQTVLYGGQALSGVIKIDTLPQQIETKTGTEVQFGTQDIRDLSVTHLEKTAEDKAFLFRGHGYWKDDISPVLGSSHTYPKNAWDAETAYIFKGELDGNIKGLYNQQMNYLPSADMNYNIVDTDDFKQFARQLAMTSNFKLNNHILEPSVTLGLQNTLRHYEMPLIYDDYYGSNLRTARLELVPYNSENVRVLTGLSYTFEDFVYRGSGIEQSNSFSEQRGLFAKSDIILSKNFELSFGGRIESWADKQPTTTYQTCLTAFKNTKFEISTGYKIPSAFQLYSTYGSPDLKEEKSIQYSISQDIPLNKDQQISLTLFEYHFSNLITTQGSNNNLKYVNANKTHTKGLELAYSVRPSPVSSLSISYGYQEPRDEDNNRWLARRPLVNGSIKYQQSWGLQLANIELIGVGERLDLIGNANYTSLPGYITSNASYSYDLGNGFSAYTRFNNLFNHRYQDTYSYYTEGFSAVFGGEYWF